MTIKPLKTIGLIGGVSWTSTEEYYKRLNEKVYSKYGGYNSAKLIMYSFNFAEILQHQKSGNAEKEAHMLIQQSRVLENAGANLLLICSNTTNKTASEVKKHVKIPLLELVPLTAKHALNSGYKTLGLIGTKYVMYGSFYRKILNSFGIKVVSPPSEDGMRVHSIIYDELVKGDFNLKSKSTLENIVNSFSTKNVDAVVLGCTELPLVVKQRNVDLPVIDTIEVHVNAVLEQVEK